MDRDLVARLLRVEVLETDVGADEFKLTFANAGRAVLRHPELAKQARIGVQIRDGVHVSPIRYGYVVGARGWNELTVICHGISKLLDRESRADVYEDQTITDIVADIAQRNGFRAVIQITEKPRKYAPAQKTDAQVLADLAKDVGFAWWTEVQTEKFYTGTIFETPSGDVFKPGPVFNPDVVPGTRLPAPSTRQIPVLYFQERDFVQEPMAAIDYERDQNILIADPEWEEDYLNVPGTIFSDIQNPLATTFEAAVTSIGAIESYAKGRGVWDKRDAIQQLIRTTLDSEVAQEDLDSLYRRYHQQLAQLTLTMVGDPRWRARRTLDLRNFGVGVDARYYIHEIRWFIERSAPLYMEVSVLTNALDFSASELQNRLQQLRALQPEWSRIMSIDPNLGSNPFGVPTFGWLGGARQQDPTPPANSDRQAFQESLVSGLTGVAAFRRVEGNGATIPPTLRRPRSDVLMLGLLNQKLNRPLPETPSQAEKIFGSGE